jgi:hypothetical protein
MISINTPGGPEERYLRMSTTTRRISVMLKARRLEHGSGRHRVHLLVRTGAVRAPSRCGGTGLAGIGELADDAGRWMSNHGEGGDSRCPRHRRAASRPSSGRQRPWTGSPPRQRAGDQLHWPAIVVGHVARRQIQRTGRQGAGLALAGLLFGWLVLLLGVVAVVGLAVVH